MTRSRLGRFVQVPDTWEAWAVRILTVAVSLVFVAAWFLSTQVRDVQLFMEDSRQQRTAFQQQEKARQCAILRGIGTSPAELRTLQC
jgi:hypothetical protein